MEKAARLFLLVVGIYFLMTGVAQAGSTGAGIEELTGPATTFFEALRDVDFIRIVGVVIFGLTLLMMCFGFVGAGVLPMMVMVIGLGGWFGAEAIADTLFTSGVVI